MSAELTQEQETTVAAADPPVYKIHVCPECNQHHWWGPRGGHLPGCSQPNTTVVDVIPQSEEESA